MTSRFLFAPLLAAVAALALPSLAAAHVRHGTAPAVSVQRQGATPTPAATGSTSSPAAPTPASAAAGGDSGDAARYVVTGIVLVTLGAIVVALAVLWWFAG
jgi:hypothetical protein